MSEMKTCSLVLLVCVLSAAAASASSEKIDTKLTPAEQKIAWAENTIQKDPDKFQAYNQLAVALVRRVRETSNAAYYAQAEEAVNKSLRLAPGNFEAQKAQVSILLGRQEFAQALEQANALNRKAPDDVPVYGYIAEAAIGLGDYDEAEKAAQWMLDLRPGNVPGLIEGASLRKLYGDIEGALDFLSQAYQQTPPNEVETAAWLLTEMADLQLAAGRVEVAEKLFDQALAAFPAYYRALEGMAQVRTARRQYAAATEALRERNRSFPTPRSLYQLAEALDRAGRSAEASAAYADFESQARPRIESADNANRELIFYYADHAHKPAEALRIARLEVRRRHDVFTLDACAWALYVNGEYAEARAQIAKALAVGIRDRELSDHAGRIASVRSQESEVRNQGKVRSEAEARGRK